MGFLAGKKILITGMISNRSIAYGVAKCCHREGAELAFTYQGDKVRDRVLGLAGEFSANASGVPLRCGQRRGNRRPVRRTRPSTGMVWTAWSIPSPTSQGRPGRQLHRQRHPGKLPHRPRHFQLFLHRPGQGRPAHDGRPQRFHADHDLPGRGTFRAPLQRHGPGQGQPGIQRLLSGRRPGTRGIRVNGLSAGPIKTLAASGIADFNKLLAWGEKNSPLRRNVTIEEVGNTAAFLLSDLASGITGEITYVDAGFNSTAGLAVDE
jgi:enoyl-[acyl-carrier protein] reductase I